MATQEQLTVKILRDLLANFPDDMKIQVEGCDCYGSAYGLRIVEFSESFKPELLIARETWDLVTEYPPKEREKEALDEYR